MCSRYKYFEIFPFHSFSIKYVKCFTGHPVSSFLPKLLSEQIMTKSWNARSLIRRITIFVGLFICFIKCKNRFLGFVL